MKFSNGCWLLQENVACFAPAHIYYTHISEEAVELVAPTARIRQRGDTLGGVNLTIRITAPYPEVFRIQAWHHMGLKPREPEFERSQECAGLLRTEETEETIQIFNGSLRLEIHKDTAAFTFFQGTRRLTGFGEKDLAYMKTNWTGLAYDRGPEDAYMRQQLNLSVDELIYGLGERFTPFVRNGQSVEIWNEDGGTSTQQAYKNVPFYLSNRGYGVFVNHPERVSFEVASESVKKVQFSVAGESLDYFLIGGPAMKDVLVRYTDITGKPSLPAPWTFGLWLSTSFTTSYDEATVLSFVDGMLQRGIPLKVFHFDCFWMREFAWCDFTWDSRVFPDPAGLLRKLKDRGLKICLWINPYVGQESAIFREGAENGYFLKRPNGDVWQWDMWQPGLAIVDFTNPAARAWYVSKLNALMDMGVDCFKTDFGERIPTDCVYFDGSDPQKMHNYYSYIYNKTVFEAVKARKGEKDAFVFARSATAGGQKFPVHWGGDCWSDFESMAESLRGGLSLCSSGFGFWSHDIGGFENTATPDVYKRWCAFGLLSTHSRLHGSQSYRVPWLFDEESVDVLRRFTRLKARLMPYLYASAVHTHETGIPMLRSMALEFPEDHNCDYLATQYMLGESLLVAPVFNSEGIAKFYLPAGTWTNLLTGEARPGGRWYEEPCDYMHIPLYVRQNSVLALGSCAADAEYDYRDDVTFGIFELETTVSARVLSAEGTAQITVTRQNDQYTVRLETEKPCKVVFVNKGLPLASTKEYSQEEGQTVFYLNGSDAFTVSFPEK